MDMLKTQQPWAYGAQIAMDPYQYGGYPLVMTNIAMEAMAHRNRWFTYKKMVIFHGYVK
jgi:hypothetical protein